MEVFVYRNGTDRVEEGFTRDDLPTLIADLTSVVWIDLQGETEAHLALAKDILQNVFNFHHLTIEDCVEARNQPKVEVFDDYLYFIVHGIKPGETNPANFATKELDGYLGPNYLVTFHTERFHSIKSAKQQVRTSTFICKRGPAYILHRILDEIVDRYMPIVDDYDDAINQIEDRIVAMRRNDNRILGEIMDIRRSIARLQRISSRQLDVLHRMSSGEFPQIPKKMLPFYRDVKDHLQRIADVSEGYRDLASGLFDIHFAVVSNRTNDVMKTLAVISSIILPLSLVAGIYGMNFDNMPELRTRYGYFATLGAMALITVALLIYFWRQGWIFQGDAEVAVKPADEKEL
jgi:magnesium transporter